MTPVREWTVAQFLGRRITLGELWLKFWGWLGDVGREAVRILENAEHWMLTGQFPEDRIPDPLWVLKPGDRVATDSEFRLAYPGAYYLEIDGERHGPYDYRETPEPPGTDPVKRAYELVSEQRRLLSQMLYGADLTDLLDPEDWEGLVAGDIWDRQPLPSWDDVIIRGTN